MDSHPRGMPARRTGRASAPQTEPQDDPHILYDVPFVVEAELGSTHKTVREILKIAQGSVIELDRETGEPVELKVNGHLIARGEVVSLEGNYAVRITEIAD